MLKIDRTIRRKDISRHVWTQLRPVPISEVKLWIFVLTFLMLDTLCVFPVIGNTYASEYFFAVIIPTAFINIWAITILFRNFYSTQKETIYFILANSIVLAFCCFIVAQKIVYIDTKVESTAFFIISILFYFGWIGYFTQYIFRKYANMKWRYSQKNFLLDMLGVILLLLPSNGYNFYHFYIKGNPFEEYISAFVYLCLGILPIYISIQFLHRLLYIRFNSHLFRLSQLSRKEIKQEKAKGKTIKVN
ncbi:hypothetical protein SPD48_06235 [Pseudogracilibacillus sp. SE30717A]|uniref:hypothetical protein n=1 Tax=Pseudogracilibacillus sp. SE30717A TaxID=3098293 RepID=UPI00300E213A